MLFVYLFLKLYGPFLWMGFNFVKATELLGGGTLLFTTKLPSILSFPKKLLLTILNLHVLIANSEKYTLADCALSINGLKR